MKKSLEERLELIEKVLILKNTSTEDLLDELMQRPGVLFKDPPTGELGMSSMIEIYKDYM